MQSHSKNFDLRLHCRDCSVNRLVGDMLRGCVFRLCACWLQVSVSEEVEALVVKYNFGLFYQKQKKTVGPWRLTNSELPFSVSFCLIC